jgi:hypothetical protein
MIFIIMRNRNLQDIKFYSSGEWQLFVLQFHLLNVIHTY